MGPLVGLRGDRVTLVPPDRAAHLEHALRWMNDPAVADTLAFHHGVTRRQEEAWFDRVESSHGDAFHWAILAEDGRPIGFASLQDLSWRHRLSSGGLVIGDRDAWGRGYATEAVKVRTRFAFDELGLHRIEGHTINPAMRRVYEKAGYRHEGTARQKLWRGGRWHDAALYAILDADPRDPPP